MVATPVKISALPAGSALTGTEVAPFVQSSATVKITANQIFTFAQTGTNFLTPEQFGATNPAVDSFTAFSACITAALSQGKAIALGARVYLTSQTLDFQTLFVQGTGGSIIRALTNNMLVVKNGNLINVEIDGDNKALWGWLINNDGTLSPSSVRAYNTFVDQCTEYGFVTDNIQNQTFIGMYCENNLVANYVLANSTANVKFYNCTMFQATSTSYNLLLLNNNSNPHGFGLSTTNAGSNRHITFFGGIMEGTGIVNNIATQNPAATSTPGGTNSFYDYEFDAKTQILQDSTYDGIWNFIDCDIGSDNSGSALVSGAGNGAEVYFYNYSHSVCPSGYNSTGVDFGITCTNNLSKLLDFSLANFAANPPYTTHGAILTDSYTASTRTINLTCTAGSGHVDLPTDNAFAIGWREFSMDRLPIVRICFSLSGFTGGTTVDLVAAGSGTTIASGNTAGAHEVVYFGQASDNGTFQWFSGAGVTAWKLSNVSIEYL